MENDVQFVIMMLDQHFGTVRRAPGKQSDHVIGVDIHPETAHILEQITNSGAQTFVIAPKGLPHRAANDLHRFLPMVDQVIGQDKDLWHTLRDCSHYISSEQKGALFVGADRMARGTAAELGYFSVPHPTLAGMLLEQQLLCFVRITGEREKFDSLAGILPYFVERNEDGSWSLMAAITEGSMAEILVRRLHVDVLSLDLSIEDPVLVQMDTVNQQVLDDLRRCKVLYSDGRRILVALGPMDANDQFAFHGAHGHTQFLIPDPGLLRPAPAPSSTLNYAQLALSRWPRELIEHTVLDHLDLLALDCPSTATSFQADVNRYSGVAALDSAGTIQSRHTSHPDNARVVQALLADLRAMGYCAYTHSFSFGGRTLHNVIADLPGRGYFRINPDILEKIRTILIHHPWPDPPEPWLKPLIDLLGDTAISTHSFGELSPSMLRLSVEKMLNLRPWFPWWLCPCPGWGAQIVLVGCHLDSTAASDGGYNPALDAAPGADDDASGIAATLALARYMTNFRGKLTHTVRFCFFNAEESGMIGSKAYAAMLKASGAPVKGAVCMDMIGYNSDTARIFEIHAGYTDPTIRDANIPIANAVASWAAAIGTLAPAQIYQGTSTSGSPNRMVYDGAINRSDHASFHQQGYPAVVVSEDFFANLVNEPSDDPNPNYHRHGDTVIDSAYASDITCAVAFAVKDLANA